MTAEVELLYGLACSLSGSFIGWRACRQWDEENAMSKLRDSEKQIEDLKAALSAVGRILTDESVTVPRRIDRVMGILSMYDCEPKRETANA
jgi:hypothetical protein